MFYISNASIISLKYSYPVLKQQQVPFLTILGIFIGEIYEKKLGTR